MRSWLACALGLFVPFWMACGQPQGDTFPDNASGGPMLPEQASYDVTFYDLELEVDPERQDIDGRLTVEARILNPLLWFVLDLDPRLHVDSVIANQKLEFERREGRLWIRMPTPLAGGDEASFTIAYGGAPRVAPAPPWDGGFTWTRTESGEPWIAVSCQGEGADLWWPVKDHPSDEPDSMSIRVTVPEPLTVASNGRLRNVTTDDGKRTYFWFVSTPINPYGVSLNIAPYDTLHAEYRSVDGSVIPVTAWILPEAMVKARAIFPQWLNELRFLEETLGPYPFRVDKYGIAHTPYLGMEHQTVIAYGSQFQKNDYGFDWLHFHELAHEWFANWITVSDWRDFWIHEGFATYLEALYAEELGGSEAYRRYMRQMRSRLHNGKPLAFRTPQTTKDLYFTAELRQTDADVYFKGAWVLHTLRYVVGDDAFRTFLRRLTELEDPSAEPRTVDTEIVRAIAEDVAGQRLDWFFDVYVRQPELPELVIDQTENQYRFTWRTPRELPFPMPLPLQVGDEQVMLEMTDGEGEFEVVGDQSLQVDPEGWILRSERN